MKTKKFTIFAGIVFALVSLLNTVMAHVGNDEYYHHGTMGSFGMGIFGWTFMLLIIITLVLLIIWIIKQIQKSNNKR